MSSKEVKYVKKLKDGDLYAFEVLFTKYANKVYCVARKMSLGHEDAEGLVQDLFLKVWERRRDLDEHKSFNAYLLTIARSMIIKRYRKNALQTGYEKYALSYLRSSSNSTEENIIFDDLYSISSKYLDELPKKQKQVFILRNMENLTIEEIAERLDVSKRTVENQIYRASKTLRDKLSGLQYVYLLILCNL